jgi:hypothetical protein
LELTRKKLCSKILQDTGILFSFIDPLAELLLFLFSMVNV